MDMTRDTSAPHANMCDPRIVRSRQAVLRAAVELLVDGGPGAVTIDGLVARSGVAKSTIYRHWQSRDEVLFDAVEQRRPRLEVPCADDYEGALRRLVADVRRALVDPEWGKILAALIVLRDHQDGIADLEERWERRQESAVDVVLRRGIAEGCLPPDVDLQQAYALLLGPLVFARLTGRPKLTEEFCEGVVDAFLRAFRSV